jgi:RNA recognition motif-containing protein
MSKTIFVGNLDYQVTDSDLRQLFQQYGTVDSVQVIIDRDTGRSRGFGFVDMRNDQEADAAIRDINGQAMNGRPLTVNEARKRAGRANTGERPGYGGRRRSA